MVMTYMKTLAPIWDVVVTVLNIMAFVWLASVLFLVAFFAYHWITGKPLSTDYDGPDF